MENIFKVHNGPVKNLCVSKGFCVTGGEDKYVRVWPLDFSEFHLEAKHEGSIIATDIGFDGIKIAFGSDKGYLGILDLSA